MWLGPLTGLDCWLIVHICQIAILNLEREAEGELLYTTLALLRSVCQSTEPSHLFFQFVRVNSKGSSWILALILVFFIFLIIGMGAFGGYTYYKKKAASRWTWDMSTSNPEYIDTVS